ncbi:endolytic transglycosylase MltG [Rhodothermus marinus]|uniref:endolytic transglycosylase MltG n=1 Tax=Rhodothermus marinus TaxID=29549 RepID=UPI000A7E6FFF|nr:endolytic transglycosylase MltG [Rhodothermus marinus]
MGSRTGRASPHCRGLSESPAPGHAAAGRPDRPVRRSPTGRQKRRLLFADYQIDHPYNTYRFRGLPPGPITNPSPGAIDAVLYAERHDYLYFVADGEGGHVFSRTFREHVRAANRYRRLMEQRRRQARDTTGDGADG